MSHTPTIPPSHPVPATRPSNPTDALRFDWTTIVLAWGLLIGAFLDGWAHTHGRVGTSAGLPHRVKDVSAKNLFCEESMQE